MLVVHPHYYGRVLGRFTDSRGLGWYAAVTLRGKNGVLITFSSTYLTPATGGESGQATACRRHAFTRGRSTMDYDRPALEAELRV